MHGRRNGIAEGGPAAIFPAGYVSAFRSTDFDEVAAIARGWNQHYTKLKPGTFVGEVVQVHTGQAQLGTASWSCGMMSNGTVPTGSRTFGLIDCRGGRARLGGHAVSSSDLATRSCRDELHFVAPDACDMAILSLAQDLLDRTSLTMFGCSWNDLGGNAPVLRLREPMVVEAAWRRLVAAANADPARLEAPESARAFEQEAVQALFTQLDLPPPRIGAAESRRLALRAEAYLRANTHRPVTIAELCAATGAPERSLHQACRDHLGLPPIAYLRVLRLHGVRRDLRELGPATTVTDAATRWGFFHFGEFAGAYRRLFGELPSQTLRRGPFSTAA